jgi:hypothetical protein
MAGWHSGAVAPNTRVQRTRSSASPPHSPLTRCPLGGGYWQSALFCRPNLLELPAHPVGRVADMDISLARPAVQARDHRFAGLLRRHSIGDRYQKPTPSRGAAVAVPTVDSRARRYCFFKLPSLGDARVVAVLLCVLAQRSVEAAQHRAASLLRIRVPRDWHGDVTPARQLRVAKRAVGTARGSGGRWSGRGLEA